MQDEAQIRQWLRAARSGDGEAIAGLDRVVRTVTRQVARGKTASMTGSTDWEDVAQDAVLRLLSTSSGYRGDGSARGYVYATVKTSLLQSIRSTRRREGREARFAADDVSEARETAGAFDARRLADEILAGVDGACRQLLERVFFHGVSYSSLARETGHAESSVRAQLSRCLRRARERTT